jgi:Ribbon-helix-helix protein, copG family
MPARFNLRLDRKTRTQFARLARRLGVSKSELMRRALHSWAEFVDSPDSPYHLLVDLIGDAKKRKRRRPKKSRKKTRTQARKPRSKKRKSS